MDDPILDHALYYARRGYSVIPIRGLDNTYGNTAEEKEKNSKKPLLEWEEYQGRRATKEEIQGWWNRWPKANIGLVTGPVSGLYVVDADSEDALNYYESILPLTPKALTRQGRAHFYFKYPPGYDLRNTTKVFHPGVDTRGAGGYVVAPPSIHFTGVAYQWVEGRSLDIELADLPDIFLAKRLEDKTPLRDLYKGVDRGKRNNTR